MRGASQELIYCHYGISMLAGGRDPLHIPVGALTRDSGSQSRGGAQGAVVLVAIHARCRGRDFAGSSPPLCAERGAARRRSRRRRRALLLARGLPCLEAHRVTTGPVQARPQDTRAHTHSHTHTHHPPPPTP